jgi:hypothetical protein
MARGFATPAAFPENRAAPLAGTLEPGCLAPKLGEYTQ